MVTVKKELLAPCGLYCGVCAIYIANRDDNIKFKQKLVKVYAPYTSKVEDVQCTGCMSDGIVFGYCQSCSIRDCVKKKSLESCHQCNQFPCEFIKNFPVPFGKKVILRTIPEWRKLGTEKWIEAEEKRYKCPDCGNPLFRGAKRCNKCKITVDID